MRFLDRHSTVARAVSSFLTPLGSGVVSWLSPSPSRSGCRRGSGFGPRCGLTPSRVATDYSYPKTNVRFWGAVRRALAARLDPLLLCERVRDVLASTIVASVLTVTPTDAHSSRVAGDDPPRICLFGCDVSCGEGTGGLARDGFGRCGVKRDW